MLPLSEKDIRQAEADHVLRAPVRARVAIPVQVMPNLIAALQDHMRVYSRVVLAAGAELAARPAETGALVATTEIIHVDLDGFFVAVERQLDPRLASRPIVIGGQPSTHGVVVAACAEAARRGVRPGLSLAIAAARCPDAAFLDGAVERYLEASAPSTRSCAIRIRPGRAPRSSGRQSTRSSSRSARRRRRPLAARPPARRPAAVSAWRSGFASGCSASSASKSRCGIAATRAAAQIASRISRPRGVLYALPGYEARLLAPLDIGLLPDLPAGARQHLMMEGIMTLGDLAGVCDERAKALLGTRGPSFVRWARGEDDRPIDRSQPPRSIAREVTLTHANPPEAELAEVVRHLADVLAMRLRSMGWFARTVTLRLRPVAAPFLGTCFWVGLGCTVGTGRDSKAAAEPGWCEA